VCSSFEVDLDVDMLESAMQLEHPPWIGDNKKNVNTQMTAIPKRTATARTKGEMVQTREGSIRGVRQSVHRWIVDGHQVGCAIICEAREIKIRLPKHVSIFNAKTVAILEAIKATRR
jgi:hypothetical protein